MNVVIVPYSTNFKLAYQPQNKVKPSMTGWNQPVQKGKKITNLVIHIFTKSQNHKRHGYGQLCDTIALYSWVKKHKIWGAYFRVTDVMFSILCYFRCVKTLKPESKQFNYLNFALTLHHLYFIKFITKAIFSGIGS